jgi:Transposase
MVGTAAVNVPTAARGGRSKISDCSLALEMKSHAKRGEFAKRPRRNHSPAFKAKVALAAIKGEKTPAELAEQLDVYPNQITTWRSQLLEGAAGDFGAETKPVLSPPAIDVDFDLFPDKDQRVFSDAASASFHQPPGYPSSAISVLRGTLEATNPMR